MLLAAASLFLLLGGGAAAAFVLKLGPFAHKSDAAAEAERPPQPVLVDMPELVANLNVAGRRPVFVRLRAKVEAPRPADAAAVQAAMPRLQDMFTAFLRETRPEELRGSAGTQRLREELVARANIAVRPGAVSDILFVELVIQ
ncbi:MAG: flagellar basal body-associated FliL family protein [Acetobacteraceae bacterium]|nr:flagellar basal body-associated FliL family protein [Acetobacteraceae bacterium]